MWPFSAATGSVFHVLMSSSCCFLELAGSTQESDVLPSSGLQAFQGVFPLSTVDKHAALPLAPSDRLLGCLWLRLAATLRRRLALRRRLRRDFSSRLLGGLLLFGRGRPLANEVFSANFHHVILPRFHFVFVAHLVVFSQLRVYLTCEADRWKGCCVCRWWSWLKLSTWRRLWGKPAFCDSTNSSSLPSATSSLPEGSKRQIYVTDLSNSMTYINPQPMSAWRKLMANVSDV